VPPPAMEQCSLESMVESFTGSAELNRLIYSSNIRVVWMPSGLIKEIRTTNFSSFACWSAPDTRPLD
jgi:hypothetical protein